MHDQTQSQAVTRHTDLRGSTNSPMATRLWGFHYAWIVQLITRIPNPLTLSLLCPHRSQSCSHFWLKYPLPWTWSLAKPMNRFGQTEIQDRLQQSPPWLGVCRTRATLRITSNVFPYLVEWYVLAPMGSLLSSTLWHVVPALELWAKLVFSSKDSLISCIRSRGIT